MILRLRFYAFIIIICTGMVVPATFSHQLSLPLSLRTTLAQGSFKTGMIWSLLSSDGFILTDMQGVNPKKRLQASILTIAIKNNVLLFNGKKHDACAVMITPCKGTFLFAGMEYAGSVIIACHDNELSLVQYEPVRMYNEVFSSSLSVLIDCKAASEPETIVTKNAPSEIIKAPSDKQPIIESAEQATSYKVRVLLGERASNRGLLWHITSPQGFIISDPNDSKYRITSADTTIAVREYKGVLYLNDTPFTRAQAYVTPISGHITFEGKEYFGGFLIARDKGTTFLINNLDLEDYVYCVLHAETWPGWPLEINKVCAIASRTYAIAMVKRSRAKKLLYHIKNTNVHQTYNGVHGTDILRKAVDQTRGIFLAHKGEPILAMFDICCGGIIPAKITHFDFAKAPYLARSYACPYCKNAKGYSWQATYSSHNLVKALSREIPQLKKIKSIKVTKKDGAGFVQKVSVHGAKKVVTLTGKKIYSLLKPKVKSFCFSITINADTIVFKGKGHGHHMGLCQWGAREMVRRGFGYKEILQFYYPKTTFMRLH